jgi:hypothetical protein
MMDARERARRQQVAETKRRRRKFEEQAKARALAEEETVRPPRGAPGALPSRAPGARFGGRPGIEPDNDSPPPPSLASHP